MKSVSYFVLFCILFSSVAGYTSVAQGVAVNTNGAAADTSAILDVSATNKGFLPPRMTAAQIASISMPATGLIAYQTDGISGLYLNNGTPAAPAWSPVNQGTILPYNSGASAISLSENFGGPTNGCGIGFGNNTSISPFTSGSISTSGNNGSFIIPRSGVISALSYNFTTTTATSFLPNPTFLVVQVYTAGASSTTFSTTSASVAIPLLSGSAAGTILAGNLTGLSIPVTAGSKILLACYIFTYGPTTMTLSGYFSGGVTIQ